MSKNQKTENKPKAQSARKSARIRILDSAARNFYKNGYRVTGIESIAKAAGITKATLYHHFRDKDDLIAASLKHLSEFHRGNYVNIWNKNGLSAEARLLALFDAMHQSFKEPDCYGCPFINVAGEYADRSSAVRKICESHYAFLISHLEQFAHDADLLKPHMVAEQIAACIAGAYSLWFVGGVSDAAKQGKKTAELIIAAHRHKK